jgi:hypothetical protein
MKIKRHLIYRCEITGGQKYTKREVSSGCGCWTVHSTTRMTTPIIQGGPNSTLDCSMQILRKEVENENS